jgi:hypothetical protein
MIFCWDCVSCDETIVAGVDFIDRRPSGGHYPIICKGKGASGTSNEDSYSRSSISLSVVIERNSSFEGDEYASYAAPDDAIADILSSI